MIALLEASNAIQMPTWLQWTVAAPGILAALAYCWNVASKAIKSIHATAHAVSEIKEEMPNLLRVSEVFSVNGGLAVKTATLETAEAVKSLRESLDVRDREQINDMNAIKNQMSKATDALTKGHEELGRQVERLAGQIEAVQAMVDKRHEQQPVANEQRRRQAAGYT